MNVSESVHVVRKKIYWNRIKILEDLSKIRKWKKKTFFSKSDTAGHSTFKSMENSVTPKNFCCSIQEKRNTRGLYVTDFEVVGPKRSKCMQFVKVMAFWT